MRLSTLLSGAFILVLGCAPHRDADADYARRVAEVHNALLLQVDYEEAATFFVVPETRKAIRDVPPMRREFLDHLREQGMAIDSALASKLAERLSDEVLSIELPSSSRLREWRAEDSLPRAIPDAFFFSDEEGEDAAIVQRYPVAFSGDGDRALTYIDFHCGPLECGIGFVVVLERSMSNWSIQCQIHRRQS